MESLAVNEQDSNQSTSRTQNANESFTCSVCGEDISRLKQKYCFGSYVCCGCRNFFFRVIMGVKKKAMKPCAQQCHITPKTRKKCPNCRYARCLQSGMRPRLTYKTKMRKMAAEATARQGINSLRPDLQPIVHQTPEEDDGEATLVIVEDREPSAPQMQPEMAHFRDEVFPAAPHSAINAAPQMFPFLAAAAAAAAASGAQPLTPRSHQLPSWPFLVPGAHQFHKQALELEQPDPFRREAISWLIRDWQKDFLAKNDVKIEQLINVALAKERLMAFLNRGQNLTEGQALDWHKVSEEEI